MSSSYTTRGLQSEWTVALSSWNGPLLRPTPLSLLYPAKSSSLRPPVTSSGRMLALCAAIAARRATGSRSAPSWPPRGSWSPSPRSLHPLGRSLPSGLHEKPPPPPPPPPSPPPPFPPPSPPHHPSSPPNDSHPPDAVPSGLAVQATPATPPAPLGVLGSLPAIGRVFPEELSSEGGPSFSVFDKEKWRAQTPSPVGSPAPQGDFQFSTPRSIPADAPRPWTG